MSVYDNGYEVFPNPEGRLLELIIIDDERRGNWFTPSMDDVRRACGEFDLPFEEIDDLIRNMDRSTHTLLIYVPLFKKHLKEKK